MIAKLKSLLHNGVALCVIGMPISALLYDPNVIFPFITLKAFVFHSLSLLGLILFSLLFFLDEKLRINLLLLFNNKLFKSYLIYLLLIFISGIFSENQFNSFWGSSERADGIYLQLFCFYLTVVSCVILNNNQWKMVFISIISVSIILFVFQLFQFNRHYYRPGSFLNQPTFLASFYLISIGSCFLLNSLINNNKLKLIYQIITYSLAFIFIFGILISGTRASLLALILSVAVMYIYKRKEIQFNYTLIHFILSVTLILGSLLFAIYLLNFELNKSISRMFVFEGNFETLNSRLINILISLKAINPFDVGFKNFLIGWGWANYYLAWDFAYMPMINRFDPAPFDKAHNNYLDILVTTGLLGFIAFLNLIKHMYHSIIVIKNLYLKLSLLFIFLSKFLELFFTFDSVAGLIVSQIIFSYLVALELIDKKPC